VSVRLRLLLVASIVTALVPLAAQQRQAPFVLSQLTWFDRTGKQLGKLGPLAERTVGQGPEAPRELTAEDGHTIVRVVLAGRRTFLLVVTGPTALGPRDTREFFDSFATREASIDG